MTVSDFSERELIAKIASALPPAPPWMPVGIGDDAAVVEPERNRLEVLSVDALVEGVHFDRAFTPPAAIGHRALAVNLSDLAAMGAAPRLCLLSLALPPAFPIADFDAMIGGLAALAARHRIHVAGGNLTKSPGPLVLDVTVTGTAKRRQILTRSGARPGDELYVTGTIGAAAAGLQMLRDGASHPQDPASNSCVARYLYPEPRVRMGLLVARNRAAAAGMDLSDGLADAVRQLATAGGVGAEIDAKSLPIDPLAVDWFTGRGEDPVSTAISGGDDYELLVAVRPKSRRRLAGPQRHGGVALTRIGVCTEDPQVLLQCGDGSPRPLPTGYRHFR
ncbi:MAG TPA: thiamine-phosphate kinase [Vicinamibacterales bacterium]|nr:thiamine-phosphate kinase [Vicinamibacterales bacterium]